MKQTIQQDPYFCLLAIANHHEELAKIYRMLAKTSEQEETKSNPDNLFCLITKHAYETGHAQAVEDELRASCVSAPKLVKAIRTNEALGYLNSQNLSSVELYELLNEHYKLPFKLRVFQNYRSK